MKTRKKKIERWARQNRTAECDPEIHAMATGKDILISGARAICNNCCVLTPIPEQKGILCDHSMENGQYVRPVRLRIPIICPNCGTDLNYLMLPCYQEGTYFFELASLCLPDTISVGGAHEIP